MYDVAMKKNTACILVSLFIILLVASVFFSAVKATEDSWTTMASMPTARSSLGATVVDGKIYVIGGKGGEDVLV